MKNYPYIFSLSTIGLINHYNCDYLFNRTRTDFTGDSGSGKSMIADLLQLVFVGSSVFLAATETMEEKRATSGMVLSDKKRGYGGKGYVFLNIAISSTEYIIMGMYIEGSTNYTRPFIVHDGFDLENPTFLTKPLLTEDFLNNETILPIEDLKLFLKSSQHNCEILQMPGYHRFLFQQSILPFDLADNPEKLKTYALIIRSFSRGKGFKFNNEHLQDFLFGVDKEKAIFDNYSSGIDSIKNALTEGTQYQEQVDLLKDKKNKLKELIKFEKIKIEHLKEYLHNSYLYWKFKRVDSVKKLNSFSGKLSQALIEMIILDQLDNEMSVKRLQKQIQSIEIAQGGVQINLSLKEQEKMAKEKFITADLEYKRAILINDLLPKYNHSLEKLKTHYRQQAINKEEKKSLNNFKERLISKEIYQAFRKSEWPKNYKSAKENYEISVNCLQDKIKNIEALLKFANIEDKESIAYWAINRKKTFNKDEESVLIKLQELIVSQPEDRKKKYLPQPEQLFDNLHKESEDEQGFWMSLNGIQEYVPFVDKQFLNNSDPNKKREFFLEKYTNGHRDLTEAKKELEEKHEFYSKLNSISGLEESIEFYQRQNSISQFNTEELLEITENEFNACLNNYTQKEEIEQEYGQANEELSEATSLLTASNEALEAIKGIKDVSRYLFDTKEKLDKEKTRKYTLEKSKKRLVILLGFDAQETKDIQESIQTETNSSTIAEITKIKTKHEDSIREERRKLKNLIREAKKQLIDLQQKYENNALDLPQGNIDNIQPIVLDESLQRNYELALNKYSVAFEGFVELYLLQDKYKYESESDWRKLARATLPEVFKNIEITEEQFTSEIDERLEKIIEQNTIIGDRKIQTLLTIFDQVEDTFSFFSEEVSRLKNFFSGNDKRITGGYKVVLKLEPSQDYPIKWITEFKKQIRQEAINRTGIFKIVDDNIDFKDIIQKVFRECGGKKQDPALKDLLNPKKYFSLTFKMEKENVSNSGSSGQVYSAIALMCIARISLLERDDKFRKNKGIRFMPIDEAEGLGSNYEMLSDIAKSEDYQIISMSINPVGEFEEGSHYIYMLNEPEDEELKINGEPFAQFTEEGITENLHEYIYDRFRL